MKKFIKSLKFIFKPSWWYMENEYSEGLDIFINDLLDNYKFKNITHHTAELGGIKFWIANSPYSCFHTYWCSHFDNYRPSRLTIERAIKRLAIDYLENINKKANEQKEKI